MQLLLFPVIFIYILSASFIPLQLFTDWARLRAQGTQTNDAQLFAFNF